MRHAVGRGEQFSLCDTGSELRQGVGWRTRATKVDGMEKQHNGAS